MNQMRLEKMTKKELIQYTTLVRYELEYKTKLLNVMSEDEVYGKLVLKTIYQFAKHYNWPVR